MTPRIFSESEIEEGRCSMRSDSQRILSNASVRERAALIGWAFEYTKALRSKLNEDEIERLYWLTVRTWLEGSLPQCLFPDQKTPGHGCSSDELAIFK